MPKDWIVPIIQFNRITTLITVKRQMMISAWKINPKMDILLAILKKRKVIWTQNRTNYSMQSGSPPSKSFQRDGTRG